jgi:peptide-methionine (R)-S-oxide reductase
MDRRDILKALLAAPLVARAAPPRDAAGVQALQRDWKALLAQGADVTLDTAPLQRSSEEWKKVLTPQQYNVLREEGTERPGSSPLNGEKRPGVFACAGCSLVLFTSAMKYDSGTGWPSFHTPLESAVGTTVDRSLFMTRTEVHCRRCGGHLGHVFDDGPPPTGLRYCMNGVAMIFVPETPAPAAPPKG